MVKVRTLVLLLAIIPFSVAVVNAQNYSSYLKKARAKLEKGDCQGAMNNYDIYKSYTGKMEADVEQAIRECFSNSVPTEERITFKVGDVSFDMIYVEGGTFVMGNDKGDSYEDERPPHNVTLKGYYISETEVTQSLWTAVMGNNPSSFKGDNLPVESVNYNDCGAFCRELSQSLDKTFRLPTEAEWEFAASGGVKSKGEKFSGSSEIEKVAWYTENSENKTHPVKTKEPNELGIYDMSGNVWEWCSDWYGDYDAEDATNPQGPQNGTDRVLRGGCWYNFPGLCRVTNRGDYTPVNRGYYHGFRIVMVK